METILGLIKVPPAKVEGEILYKGKNLVGLSNKAYRDIRGKEISMIFQEPISGG